MVVLCQRVAALVVLGLALWFPIETLAKATSYSLLLVFSLVNLSLWRLKRGGDQPADILRAPAWVPATGFLASFLFVVIQVILDVSS